MQSFQAQSLRRIHLAIDAVAIVSAMSLAAILRPTLRAWFPFLRELVEFSQYATLVYAALPLWLALVVAFELHTSFERVWPPTELVGRLLLLHGAGLMSLALLQFLTQSVVNRSLVAAFLACSFALMFAVRMTLNAWVRYQHRRGQSQARFLCVGQPSPRMAEFVRDVLRSPLPPVLLGYLRAPAGAAESSVSPYPMDLKCLGDINDLGRVLHAEAVDQVMFFPPSNNPQDVREALAQCEELGVVANFSVALTQLARSTPRLSSVYEHPFVSFEMAPKHPAELALKYGLDPLLAAALLVLLSPLLLVVAAAIVATMGRPVLYAQDRAGLHGRTFKMLKFRSMVADADQRKAALAADNEMTGPVFKITNDPRVTPLGRFIRATSIDELPQLFNVLTGSMSLVGPRPLPVAEQEQIRGWQRRRLSMKPGITGLWQVSGRSNLDFEEWMQLDLKYVEQWSLTLDFILLLRTIPAVLLRRGAR